ncbi:transglutaminase domain-containing protein [Winogradskyella maritima]|nr:transglutaminase domain-containing protein [Winogradskyella maritima]
MDAQLSHLAFSITQNSSSQHQKAKAIYRWIITNINYDFDLRLSKSLQKKIYTSEYNVIAHVLKRKKALCGGYAFLFKALCERVGISSEYIHGFTKMATSYNAPNHTWNAVKLNGQWHLLDLTWANSHKNANHTDDYWFLTNPEIFVRSHFPLEERWTLLKDTPRLSDFANSSSRP